MTALITDRLPEIYGMLLILGVLGTLVALEHAVALGYRLGYLAPGLLAAGGLALVTPAPLRVGQLLLLTGVLALLLLYRPLWLRQRDPAVLTQALGAVLAAGAALLWSAGVAFPTLLPWLAGFMVLTVGGRRVELARLGLSIPVNRYLPLVAGAVTAAAPVTLLFPGWGHTLYGLVLLAATGWLLQHDVARRAIRAPGAARFVAVAMLTGYGCLLAAGAIWLLGGAVVDGPGHAALMIALLLFVLVAGWSSLWTGRKEFTA